MRQNENFVETQLARIQRGANAQASKPGSYQTALRSQDGGAIDGMVEQMDQIEQMEQSTLLKAFLASATV